MTEDCITFELAKKLKEKGFREPCGYVYNYKRKGLEWQKVSTIWNNSEYWFAAPTISQVLKWLREEKKIYIEMLLYSKTYSYYIKSVSKMDTNEYHKCLNDDDTTEIEHETYEEAALAGIEYCLDNLI